MQILFKDEKFKAETIEILSDLMKDAGIYGEPQVNIELRNTNYTVMHQYMYM